MNLKVQNFKTEKYLLFFWFIIIVLLFRNFRALSFYHVNDDFFLFGIASGVLYGFSSADILFISAPVNHILKELFEVFPEVNWYYELIFLNMFAALMLYSYFLYKQLDFSKKLNYLYFIVANLVPIFIFFKMFYLIQFSQVAIISTALGVVVLLKRNKKLLNALAAFLVILGFSWRSEAAILATGLVVSVYMVFIFLNKDFSIFKEKRIYLVLSTISILFILKSINFLGFAPWQSEEINEVRKPTYEQWRTVNFNTTKEAAILIQKAAKSIGWSQNDYNLYLKKYIADENIYSLENLDRLASESKPYYSINYFATAFIELSYILVTKHAANLVAVFIFLITLVLLNREKKYVKNILIYTLLFFIFIFLVYLLGKIPNRIFWPLGFVFLLSVAGVIAKPAEANYFNSRIPVALSVLTLSITFLMAFNVNMEINNLQWWKQVKEEKVQGFDRVLNFKSDKPIVAFSSFFSPLIDLLDPSSSDVDQIFRDMVYINWATRTPDYNTHLANLDLNRNLFTEIAKGNAYLGTANLEELQMVNQYLIEHHQVEPVWDVAPFVYSDTGLGIWQILEVKQIAK